MLVNSFINAKTVKKLYAQIKATVVFIAVLEVLFAPLFKRKKTVAKNNLKIFTLLG